MGCVGCKHTPMAAGIASHVFVMARCITTDGASIPGYVRLLFDVHGTAEKLRLINGRGIKSLRWWNMVTASDARLSIVPVTFREACAFVARLHRHNKPPQGHKFSIGLSSDESLAGVAMVGRPVARHADDGATAEITRTCTDGTPHANSMLYGACMRACRAMGYRKVITYTQGDESGSSLRAAGFRKDKALPARGSWGAATADERLKAMRDPIGTGGVDRVRWVWP